MSGLDAAIGTMAKALKAQGGISSAAKKGGKATLHPNTIYDICSTAAAVGRHAKKAKFSTVEISKTEVPGTTAPANRDPKGRYLKFPEMGRMIDAAAASKHPHSLHLLLLVLGCGCRVGAMGAIIDRNLKRKLDVIDLLGAGEIATNKRKPIVPITGPMSWVLDEASATAGRDGRLIHYRGQGIGGENWTQVWNRIRDHAIRDAEAQGDAQFVKEIQVRANWYSVRRTVIDWLKDRVPDAAISSVAGHVEVSPQDRRRLFEEGSPMTELYQRRSLKHTYEVGAVLESKWWPQLQAHCKTDLRLKTGVNRMQELLKSLEEQQDKP